MKFFLKVFKIKCSITFLWELLEELDQLSDKRKNYFITSYLSDEGLIYI